MSQPPSPFEPNPWAPPQDGSAEQQTGTGAPPPPPPAPGQGFGNGPQTPFPYGYPPQPEAPKNGMGVTALVLGIVGLVLGLAIVVFWLSWLPAVLAVIFGAVALGHVKKGIADNKGMALTGMIMGMVGVLLAVGGGIFTMTTLRDSVREYEDQVLEVEASESPEPKSPELTEAEKKLAELEASRSAEADAEADAAKPKAFGTTYTFPDGVSVKVDKPVPYTASSTASGHTKGYRTYTVKITMTNGSKEKFDSLYAIPRFKDADEAEVQKVFDGDVPTSFRGSLRPGKTKTAVYAYDLPPEAAGTTFVELSPGVGWPDAVWSGPTK
ncbi:DUF4190 domain-containing protein [Streptomyces finlayi]|nr:DUF4190 domain-containing protein [Streptomyces finlayi]